MQLLKAGDKKISYIRRRDHELKKNERVANFEMAENRELE